MISALSVINNTWTYLFDDLADERTKGWFLTGSPVPILLIAFLYSKVIKQFGPEFMKDRKPFNIDKIIQIYNLLQIALCGWVAFEGFRYTYGPSGSYDWNCQPMDTSMSPTGQKVVFLTWVYYMIKVFDLLDTVFFVLRKKYNQISFLHFYHHTGVLALGYMGTTYYPDGQGFIIVPLNCFVHCFMYSYYFLSNYNPEYKKNIWWKKHITQLQIVQFLIIALQASKVLLMPSCTYPWFPIILLIPHICLMLWLFSDFYYHAYLKPKTPVKAQ